MYLATPTDSSMRRFTSGGTGGGVGGVRLVAGEVRLHLALAARHEDPHHAREHVADVERHADGRVHEEVDRLLHRLLVVRHVTAPQVETRRSLRCRTRCRSSKPCS